MPFGLWLFAVSREQEQWVILKDRSKLTKQTYMVCLVIQAKDAQISSQVFAQCLCTVKMALMGKT